jgi:hypothetical protein
LIAVGEVTARRVTRSSAAIVEEAEGVVEERMVGHLISIYTSKHMDNNMSDIFTKPLAKTKFCCFVDLLRLCLIVKQ